MLQPAGSWLGPKWWTCCSDTSRWFGPLTSRWRQGSRQIISCQSLNTDKETRTAQLSVEWNYAIISDPIRIHEYILHRCGVVLHEQKLRRESRIRVSRVQHQTMAVGDLAPSPSLYPSFPAHISAKNFEQDLNSQLCLCASVWWMNEWMIIVTLRCDAESKHLGLDAAWDALVAGWSGGATIAASWADALCFFHPRPVASFLAKLMVAPLIDQLQSLTVHATACAQYLSLAFTSSGLSPAASHGHTTAHELELPSRRVIKQFPAKISTISNRFAMSHHDESRRTSRVGAYQGWRSSSWWRRAALARPEPAPAPPPPPCWAAGVRPRSAGSWSSRARAPAACRRARGSRGSWSRSPDPRTPWAPPGRRRSGSAPSPSRRRSPLRWQKRRPGTPPRRRQPPRASTPAAATPPVPAPAAAAAAHARRPPPRPPPPPLLRRCSWHGGAGRGVARAGAGAEAARAASTAAAPATRWWWWSPCRRAARRGRSPSSTSSRRLPSLSACLSGTRWLWLRVSLLLCLVGSLVGERRGYKYEGVLQEREGPVGAGWGPPVWTAEVVPSERAVPWGMHVRVTWPRRRSLVTRHSCKILSPSLRGQLQWCFLFFSCPKQRNVPAKWN